MKPTRIFAGSTICCKLQQMLLSGITQRRTSMHALSKNLLRNSLKWGIAHFLGIGKPTCQSVGLCLNRCTISCNFIISMYPICTLIDMRLVKFYVYLSLMLQFFLGTAVLWRIWQNQKVVRKYNCALSISNFCPRKKSDVSNEIIEFTVGWIKWEKVGRDWCKLDVLRHVFR